MRRRHRSKCFWCRSPPAPRPTFGLYTREKTAGRYPLYRAEITGEHTDDHPRKFVKFHIHHIVHGRSVSEKAVADAIELSDTKYCSVAATVRPTAEITTSYEIVEAPEAD